ncbi:MAG: hypothetical protein HY866_18745 [Chloroflexi bacterium]|nr:hypothetical protein [Chloroflexota bacterium]
MSEKLVQCLIVIGDALQAVSLDRLRQRGGWDWDLFDEVLARVEQQTPQFQALLVTFLCSPEARRADQVAALLAVDRLSAAYTYWTRLFPPRQNHDDSMFVLSLLHDLSEKVEHAIRVIAPPAE